MILLRFNGLSGFDCVNQREMRNIRIKNVNNLFDLQICISYGIKIRHVLSEDKWTMFDVPYFYLHFS